MKALFDQNLSFRLVEIFLPRFIGSCHVRDMGLTGDDDERIWALAETAGFIIFTKYGDFLERDVFGRSMSQRRYGPDYPH